MIRRPVVAATAAVVAVLALGVGRVTGAAAPTPTATTLPSPAAAVPAGAGPAAVAFARELLACPPVPTRAEQWACGRLADVDTAVSFAAPDRAVVLLTATLLPSASAGDAAPTPARTRIPPPLPIGLRLELAWRAAAWAVIETTPDVVRPGEGGAR